MTLRLQGPPLRRARWRLRAWLRDLRAARQAPPGPAELWGLALAGLALAAAAARRGDGPWLGVCGAAALAATAWALAKGWREDARAKGDDGDVY